MSLISRQKTQSSAKTLISESMSVEISFMYRENNNVTSTVPCGTPDKTGAHSEVSQFTTACVL